MSDLEIKEFGGIAAASIVLPLYTAEGNGITIRDSDLFFAGLVEGELVGSVRFCIEQETPMLRTMRVAKKFQGKGYGHRLLKYFESYLVRNEIKTIYCIPYSHLEHFYGSIGFKVVQENSVPVFLQERLRDYHKQTGAFICMSRKP